MTQRLKRRRDNRTKAVLPVKVCGIDNGGKSYQDLAHTLDITLNGARLGTVHRQFALGDSVLLQYRQHKAEFRVIWTKLLTDRGEYQVGLEMLSLDRDPWGLRATSNYGAVPATV